MVETPLPWQMMVLWMLVVAICTIVGTGLQEFIKRYENTRINKMPAHDKESLMLLKIIRNFAIVVPLAIASGWLLFVKA